MKRIIQIFTLTALAMLLLAGCAFGKPYEFKGTLYEPPQPIPDFELLDTNGQQFHLSQTKGKIVLIYFGYTYCPDVCPLTMVEVRNALNSLDGGRERVQPIFVSVDPDRDTPEVLEKYVHNFDASIIGLRDDFDKTLAVMKPFGAFAEIEDVSGESQAGYLVSHTARLYLLDTGGNLLLSYPFGFGAEELAADLTHLLAQE